MELVLLQHLYVGRYIVNRLLVAILVILSCGVTSPRDSGAPISDDYYSQPCQQPQGVSFEEWFEQLEPPQPWIIGGWDCSQVSAWAEWLAENCGYHALLAFRFGNPGHAWLLVEIDGEWKAYEVTLGLWLDSVVLDLAWESPTDTYWGSDEAFYKSWGWWISQPALAQGGIP